MTTTPQTPTHPLTHTHADNIAQLNIRDVFGTSLLIMVQPQDDSVSLDVSDISVGCRGEERETCVVVIVEY